MTKRELIAMLAPFDDDAEIHTLTDDAMAVKVSRVSAIKNLNSSKMEHLPGSFFEAADPGEKQVHVLIE